MDRYNIILNKSSGSYAPVVEEDVADLDVLLENLDDPNAGIVTSRSEFTGRTQYIGPPPIGIRETYAPLNHAYFTDIRINNYIDMLVQKSLNLTQGFDVVRSQAEHDFFLLGNVFLVYLNSTEDYMMLDPNNVRVRINPSDPSYYDYSIRNAYNNTWQEQEGMFHLARRLRSYEMLGVSVLRWNNGVYLTPGEGQTAEKINEFYAEQFVTAWRRMVHDTNLFLFSKNGFR